MLQEILVQWSWGRPLMLLTISFNDHSLLSSFALSFAATKNTTKHDTMNDRRTIFPRVNDEVFTLPASRTASSRCLIPLQYDELHNIVIGKGATRIGREKLTKDGPVKERRSPHWPSPTCPTTPPYLRRARTCPPPT